jgi:hypothetical protein
MTTLENHGRLSKIRNNFLKSMVEVIITFETVRLSEQQQVQCLNYTCNFVRGQIQSLPLMLRALFSLGMIFFRVVVMITNWSGFSGLPLEKRKMIIRSWAWGRVALARQLFRVVRSTALLAFYEYPDVQTGIIPPNDNFDSRVASR